MKQHRSSKEATEKHTRSNTAEANTYSRSDQEAHRKHEKKTSAQVVQHYSPNSIIGKQVAAVVNFPPKQIGKFMSEVLVIGFPDENGEVVLIEPGQKVPNGGRLY